MLNICAVVVTYRPKLELLVKVIKALELQVTQVVIVDNSPTNQNRIPKDQGRRPTQKIFLGANKGVAAAQNTGIKWARENGFSYVLLMDQDSVPDQNMTASLSRTMMALKEKERRIAAVGPICYHAHSGAYEPFLVRNKYRMKRVRCSEPDIFFPVEYLISSGSLISLNTLGFVGCMDESLFIDFIDIEWGFRAQSKGYQCYVACKAFLEHQLGEVRNKNLFFKKEGIIQHAPERYYYQFRNAICLFKKAYIPGSWITYQIFRQLIPRFFLQATIISPQRRNLKMMIMGLCHGLLGIKGPYKLKDDSGTP